MNLNRIFQEQDCIREAAETLASAPTTPFPILSVKIKLTWACNLRCRMCTIWERCKTGNAFQLPLDTVLDSLRTLHKQGVKKVHFSGGEVLLYPQFAEVITAARNLDLQVNLTTNATLLDKEWARFLVNARVHTVAVSIDHYNADAHDRIRGKRGAWQATLNGIRFLKDRAKRKGRGPVVAVNTVLDRQNCDETDAMFKFLEEHGIDSWRVLPIDTEDKQQRPTAEQWECLRSKLPGYSPVLARAPAFLQNQKSLVKAAKGKYAGTYYNDHICFAPWFNLFIDANGAVFPCCMGKMEIPTFGNILATPLASILESTSRRDLQCSFASGHLFDICSRCDDFLEENKTFNELTQGAPL